MTWTKKVPDRVGFWWWDSGDDCPDIIELTERDTVRWDDIHYGLAWFAREYPDSWWSSEPIKQPDEPDYPLPPPPKAG